MKKSSFPSIYIPHPDLIPFSSFIDDEDGEAEVLDQNTIQRLHVLQMQLELGRTESTFDSKDISIGVNKTTQSSFYGFSCGCQTDDIIFVDTESNTENDAKEVGTQYEFNAKSSFVQTETNQINKDTQVEFSFENASSQTDFDQKSEDKYAAANLESQIVERNSNTLDNLQKLDNETDIENAICVQDISAMSPPLSPDGSLSDFSFYNWGFPFSSAFNSIAGGLPSLGNLMKAVFIVSKPD